jgi:hypothetical protein
MRRAGMVLAILTAAVLAWPQVGEKKNEGPKPIDALAWLVGGVWTADTSAMGNGMRRIETRYQWSDNNSFLRFTTHFVFDKGTAHTYDGNFFWDPQQKSLAMWYMNSSNEIVAGTMVVEGDTWTMTFRGTNFEGKMADLRTEVIRKSPDLYHWSVSEKQADRWKELMALDYHRIAGS